MTEARRQQVKTLQRRLRPRLLIARAGGVVRPRMGAAYSAESGYSSLAKAESCAGVCIVAPQVYGNRWQVRSPLGEGGQAHTFRVTDLRGEANTSYVLKRLKNPANPARLERFKREVQAIRDLSHPNIVRLFDFDLDADKPYLVTEYCAGGSLDGACRIWSKSPVIALELFDQVCEGVAYAHAQNIVHRDIKPANVFLRGKQGPAVVGDFGICFVADDGTRVTLTDEAVGARLFMAPELEDGRVESVSWRADVYSLGKLLYWLLSDGKVFAREKHRDRDWDLKEYNADSLLGWNNVYMEHVNWLLDLMVNADPEKRRSVRNVRILVRDTIRLVRKEYNPTTKDIPQRCYYCGCGRYVLRAKEPIGIRNMGITPVATNEWRIAVCNRCGHVQLFRVDLAAEKDWWS